MYSEHRNQLLTMHNCATENNFFKKEKALKYCYIKSV